ncbi:hypothetical protein, partial [Falsiroseomonas oryziterrae]|uniref:hypothetical protein n=1 Tax=Falsiroseomonas oryziterrae TaxID=2911368 RepID=UPI001F310FE8
MAMVRLAAAALAAGLAAAPAAAEEQTTYHHLEVTVPGVPTCRAGMLLNLPPSWETGNGAVVLLTLGQPDTARDVLVSALLYERAAVLELVPPACSGRAGREVVVGAAIGALDAVTRTAGAGMVVAIAHGPGSAAVLDVVREPPGSGRDAEGARYAAAVAMGDGAPAFALGAPRAPQEDAPARLALLCRALAGIAGGIGL